MHTTRRPGPTSRVRVVELRGDQVTRHEDRLAVEEPLEIRVETPLEPARRFGVTMRTPGHDFELAVGLLRSEGVLRDLDDVRTVAYCTDQTLTPDQEFNVVTVSLGVPRRAGWQERAMSASSACGVCGKDSLSEVEASLPHRSAVPTEQVVDTALLSELPGRMSSHQAVFERTGGIHAAGVFAPDGRLLVVREDIGRHNAVDKAVGHLLLQDVPHRDAYLCTSGRVGFEIVQKAAVAGLSVIVAVGAPSSLAVELAERLGITVVGFVRGDRMVVYSHAARLSGLGQ